MSLSLDPRLRPWLKVLASVVISLALVFWVLPRVIPYGAQDKLDSLRFSPVILDHDGGELQVLPVGDGLHRVFLPYEHLPPDLVAIVTQAEDRRFWFHPGVDPVGVVRAIKQNLAARKTVSGASTISMQLARLLRPGQRESKLAEVWDALQLETRLGKRGVLELYLNLVPFGQNIEGFPAAARVFFGKQLAQLTMQELLMLAVIPRSPKVYSPFGQPGNNRQAIVRLGINQIGAGAPVEADYARVLDPSRKGIWPFRAPHFTRWLADHANPTMKSGRVPWQTGIEPEIQSYLENLLFQTVEAARTKRVSNAAALFVRPQTMTIAAWVGSINFDDESASGQVDGVIMHRQPGSTLKPFLYSLAMEQGFTAATVLPDIPTDFGSAEVYAPANFNDQFNGPVRLRQALASSLNVPAVYTLQKVGVRPFTDRLIAAGFLSLEAQKGSLGLGLALGNAEVSLFELVQAYGLFEHDGGFVPIGALRPSADARIEPRPVIQAAVTNLIRDILTRHPDRVLAFGRDGNSRLQFESAMKTGTSNQFNNIWAVGFTPDLLGGVWLGNFGGQTVVGTADSGYPAGVMAKMLETFGAHQTFSPLSGFQRVTICSLSGMLATDACPHVIQEWFLPGTIPQNCNWHAKSADKFEVNYPQEYRSWIGRYRYRPADGFQASGLAITRPHDGAVFFMDPTLPLAKQQLPIEATGNGSAELRIDGSLVLAGSFPVKTWYQLSPGKHRISLNDGENSVETGFEVR